MKRLLLVLALMVALGLATGATVSAAATSSAPTLHRYSHGVRVKNLQWILKGHKPSAHRHLKTYHAKIDGHYGVKTARAVRRMKYLLGYPNRLTRGRTAGAYFTAVLEGKAKRPVPWIARAAKRDSKYFKRRRIASSTSACQKRVVGYARSQIGVHEVPMGSNWGPQVATFQSVTGAYHAPWCVSFAQWVLWRAHVGPIANRTASAAYLRDWAWHHGWLHSRPEVGSIAVWVYSDQHASVVDSVSGTHFTTVDGNWGDSVAHVSHDLRFGGGVAFVYIPHCYS